MDTRPGWRTTPLLALTITAACGTQDRLPLEPSSQTTGSQSRPREIAGRILGPDGTSICNFVPPQDEIIVFAFPFDPVPFPEPNFVACPNNRFTFTVEPGTYLLRAEFLALDDLGNLPTAYTVMRPVTVEDSDVGRNIRIEEGTPLRGVATLNGQPFAGVPVQPFNEFFLPVTGNSGSNGRWEDVLPQFPFPPVLRRRPMILQDDIVYQIISDECSFILGTRALESFPLEPFVFPSERQRVDCELETGPTAAFTHTFNRIALTPFPGDIGGLSDSPRLPDLGTGYGVQFPNPPGQTPPHEHAISSQLFRGGLIIGVGRETVLTGVSSGGYLECPDDLENGCRDLGLNGEVKVFSSEAGRKTVIWRYSDAPSGERVGLRVVQRSFDAPRGKDYVLFRFTISNHSQAGRTISPGIWTDWDVDEDPFEDIARAQRNGRLLSLSNAFEGGTTRVGTLMFGETSPSPGFFFYNGEPPQPLSQQIRALKGTVSRIPSDPGDLRYIQGINPLHLRPGEETDLWVAVFVGEDDATFSRLADAAAEDIRERRRNLREELVAEQGLPVEFDWSAPATIPSAAARAPVCWKDCLMKKLRDSRVLRPENRRP